MSDEDYFRCNGIYDKLKAIKKYRKNKKSKEAPAFLTCIYKL